ncbi:MAG: hypothetical protein J6B50_11240 [Lachnospiraceae bacterium]|nr:hypothetical protein [Lachnospiraceae bacterium]
MEKKNPYVTTVGFNKDDPDHVRVAELLNSMGRSKAQYIVKAVLGYQNMLANGGEGLGSPSGSGADYDTVKRMVYQILKELKQDGNELVRDIPQEKTEPEAPQEPEDSILSSLDENAMNGILASIAAFQSQ